jgi:DNA polymerase-3 subunit delta'
VPDVAPQQLAIASVLAEGSPGQAAAYAMSGATVTYQELLSLLATLPRLNHGMIHGFAERVVKQLADRTVSEVSTLLSLLVQRHLRASMGTLAPMAVETEAFRRMAQALPGQGWSEFWTDLRSQYNRADMLNLDKKQFVLNAFYSIESAIRP